MMTIEASDFLRILIGAQIAGEYPDDGRYYRVAYHCQARAGHGGQGWVNEDALTLDEAQQAVEHLQARATRDGNLGRCVYVVKTLAGVEVYRTELSTNQDSQGATRH